MSVSFSDPLHGWTIGSIDDDPACYVSRTRPLTAGTTAISARVSRDGGEHWQPRGPVPVRAAQVVARSAAEAWVWGPGLAHTTDGGRHWRTIFDGTTLNLAVAGNSIWRIAQCPRARDATQSLCLARSQNDGGNWTQRQLPVNNLAGGPDAVLTTNVVRAGARDGWLLADSQPVGPPQFWRTADGGATWQRLPEPCAGPTSQRPLVGMGGSARSPGLLTAVDAAHLFVMCTGGAADGSQGKAVLASADSGGSWQWTGANPQLPGYPAAIATPDLETIVWSGPRTVLNASFDGGRTWAQPASTDARVAFDPADGGLGPIVFAAPGNGWTIGQYTGPGSVIWRTIDGGHTWSPIVLR